MTKVVIAEDEAIIQLDLKETLEEEGTTSSARPAAATKRSTS